MGQQKNPLTKAVSYENVPGMSLFDAKPLDKGPRVISMVPSWTETLISAGVNVVGRTRFCIHPQEVKTIPVVGGTKNWDMNLIQALNPDFLVIDQEENPKEFYEEFVMQSSNRNKVLLTHVDSVMAVSLHCRNLAVALGNKKLQLISEQWKTVENHPNIAWSWEQIPGVVRPELAVNQSLASRTDQIQSAYNAEQIEKIVYVIWKDPWMAVGPHTFIYSVLEKLGASRYLFPFQEKYPKFEFKDFDLGKTFFLLSTEPFPFHRKTGDLTTLGIKSAIVDGESYSWFGVRSLEFLQRQMKIATG